MIAWLAGTLTQLVGYWLPAGHMGATPSASGLMAVAAVALTGMLAAFLAHSARIAAAVAARPAQPGGAVGMLLRVIPYATVAIAAVAPLAAGLYLLTTTTWAAAERAVITRRMSPGRTAADTADIRPHSRSV